MWLAQITGMVCRADLLSPWLFLWQTIWLHLVKPLYFFFAILFTVEENTHWSDLIFTAICWICRLLPHTSGLPFSAALKCKLFQSGADQNLRRTQSRTTRVCWTSSRHDSRRDPSSSHCPRLIFHSRPSHSIAIVFFFLSFLICCFWHAAYLLESWFLPSESRPFLRHGERSWRTQRESESCLSSLRPRCHSCKSHLPEPGNTHITRQTLCW